MTFTEWQTLLALISMFFSLTIAQTIKFVTWSINDKKPHWRALIATGGWPSSHSALVISLTASLALSTPGFLFLSTYFAISVALSIVVIHDAMGVRLEASKHAERINEMTKTLSEQGLVEAPKKKLKIKLGHRPYEVLLGVLLGIIIALICYLIFKYAIPYVV